MEAFVVGEDNLSSFTTAALLAHVGRARAWPGRVRLFDHYIERRNQLDGSQTFGIRRLAPIQTSCDNQSRMGLEKDRVPRFGCGF